MNSMNKITIISILIKFSLLWGLILCGNTQQSGGRSQNCINYQISRCAACQQRYRTNLQLCLRCTEVYNQCCFNPGLIYTQHPAAQLCSGGGGGGRNCLFYNTNNCLGCRNQGNNCLTCIINSNNCCINPTNPQASLIAQQLCSGGNRECTFYNINNCAICPQFGQNCANCVLNTGRCCVNPLDPQRQQLVQQVCNGGGGRNCFNYNMNNCANCRALGQGCFNCVINSSNCCANPIVPNLQILITQFCAIGVAAQS